MLTYHLIIYLITLKLLDKTEQDIEREQSLVEQWVNLTEERNAVLVPAPGSGIPGAPADWNSPLGKIFFTRALFLFLHFTTTTLLLRFREFIYIYQISFFYS